jgi:hypothetical protein
MTALTIFVWCFPIAEVSIMLFGLGTARFDRRHKSGSGATEAIIQITTIGNHETVNWIVQRLRDYELPFPLRIWIVTEPFVPQGFVGMDEVLVVPGDFQALAKYKARAQEYSRIIRKQRGLSRHDVKVIMLDDDTLPTRKFLVDVFNADYDVCEGVTTPRLHYGRFLSHMDDLRTLSCLTICSAFQGHGHPIWVHGEGLCVRGSAEDVVTWDYPIVASEDLVFGQNAVERRMTWGFVWEYVQLTSPWTIKDFIKQRRRWIWGNIYAIRLGLLPPLGTALLVARYILGLAAGFVLVATLLVPLGFIYIPEQWYAPLFLMLALWLTQFAYAAWVGSSYEERPYSRRIRDAAIGVLLAPITSAMTFLVIMWVLFKGDPKRFEVIAKVRPDRPSSGTPQPAVAAP